MFRHTRRSLSLAAMFAATVSFGGAAAAQSSGAAATSEAKPAQARPAQSKPSTKPASKPAPARSWSAEETAARNAIISSKEWGDTMRSFDEWQSVQQTYDKQQARQLRIRLIDKINSMDAEQLKEFLPTLEQKLAILLSAEARQARSWFRQNLDLASDQYADKMRKKLPDIARMTPEQLQESLDTFENKVTQQQKVQQEFNQGRQQQVKNVESELKRQRDEQEENISRAYESSQSAGGGGFYSPGMPYNPPSYNAGFSWWW